MSIGSNIKKLRKEKGLTQAELGKLLDMTQSAIGQFENDKTSPKMETIEKIAAALEISPAAIMGFEYWDLKDPDHVKKIKEQLGFEPYLRSIGFAVKSNPIEWHWEDENETDPAKQVKVADKEEYTLTKDGNSVIFTDEEFEKLRLGTKETVEGQFYIKLFQQKQRKEEK